MWLLLAGADPQPLLLAVEAGGFGFGWPHASVPVLASDGVGVGEPHPWFSGLGGGSAAPQPLPGAALLALLLQRPLPMADEGLEPIGEEMEEEITDVLVEPGAPQPLDSLALVVLCQPDAWLESPTPHALAPGAVEAEDPHVSEPRPHGVLLTLSMSPQPSDGVKG